HGSVSEVALGATGWDGDVDFGQFGSPFDGANRVVDLFGSILGTMVLALLVCLVLLVARRPLERVEAQLAAEPWKAALAGLAAVFLSVPLLVVVSILLVLTIVGCALFLLYPFLFLGIALLALLGYAAAAYRLGRWLEVRFNRRFGGPYVVALIGVLAIQVWSILGRLIGLPGGPLGFFATMLVLFGGAVQVVAWVMGFGAVLLARFGTGPRPWPGAVAPVGPVPPPAPMYPETPAPDPAYPASYPADPVEPYAPSADGPSPLPEAWEGPRGTGGGGT
ncbi:MAG TPA: hypothetical protein VEL74_18240, partial [Thermoanaerobaculia bacterium]|nr:hypothetical protein [Thermoanaerobaculia bacterium]